MQTKPEKDTELRDKVNRETARMPWTELLKHFAQGNVVWVADSLDLVDVAVRISHDDKASIGKWMEAGLLAKVNDEQAQGWLESNAQLWASVVSPFILVQQQKAVPANLH
ncbi:hypothetical protein J2X54_001661 [Duganella sp. 3397]|uniref:DUF2288 domain-containing protein n=1 Tax=Duganella phyllosphaerae TaxID=762836 RepID=A0A1E7W6L1_9BURK|nr:MULTISPECIES: DUF2288 domain-containing protein [Duganella]MDR7049213.1 hypothetical protein [Duganella sp. 3397]OEZ91585.1 hypothetical protein DUPY_51980 [Duganella phyllosphaerae]